MKSVALHNLGCKVNGYEMDVMQQILQENGYKIVPFDEKADIYIVNTCTVTNIADRKSRQMLHRARKNNPEAVVVAAGCYVQAGKAVLEDAAVDVIIGNHQKQDLLPILEEFLAGRGMPAEKVDGTRIAGPSSPAFADGISKEKSNKALLWEPAMIINTISDTGSVALTRTAGHTRAYIKIQDGCNQFCSYCIIPYVRGRVKSRSMRDIIAEAEGLVRNGYQEIVLTGIHISSYGMDFGTTFEACGTSEEKKGLLALIECLHEIPGLKRIRLGSLEPRIITPKLAGAIAKLDKVCPHFHLSLQSGCDDTLKRMNRHYTTEEYFHKIALLRQAYAGTMPAFTTDIIVGFPGESEAEFSETERFLRKVSFSEMHVFKYSKRSGTKAAEMKEQISEQCKKQRSDKLIALNRIMAREFRECFKNKEAQVLIEESREIAGCRYWIGHTGEYVKVAVKAKGFSENTPDKSLRGKQVKGLIKDFLTPEILLIPNIAETEDF